uniref:Myeloid leukemia factor n=1 Tax=Setaria digitata TaxID=48799 RepID=A0A915PYW3_9BILA
MSECSWRNIHHQMRQQMRDMDQMMNSLMDPFGMFNRHSMFAGMLEDTPRTRPSHRDDMALMDPLGFGGGFFGGIMRQMEDMQAQAMNDPNSHVFSHSTMISFDGRNGGQPRVVEKSIRKTGDVKETRHAIRTGEDGVGDKLTIGHTIGDRTHVIEKKRDRDGRIRERQSFVNLSQGVTVHEFLGVANILDEAEAFDREFASRARRNLMGGRSDNQRSRAIEGGNKYGGSTSNNRSHTPRIGGSGTNAPIVTLPDEEDDSDVLIEEDYGRGKRSGARFGSTSGGPVIREMTDDEEDDGSSHKRRKGVFGRLFKANDE